MATHLDDLFHCNPLVPKSLIRCRTDKILNMDKVRSAKSLISYYKNNTSNEAKRNPLKTYLINHVQ